MSRWEHYASAFYEAELKEELEETTSNIYVIDIELSEMCMEKAIVFRAPMAEHIFRHMQSLKCTGLGKALLLTETTAAASNTPNGVRLARVCL